MRIFINKFGSCIKIAYIYVRINDNKTHTDMSYQNLIIESTGCTQEEVNKVEDHMRNDILHSTLDWLSKSQFKKAAKEAYEMYKYIELLKPYAESIGKEYYQLTDEEMDIAVSLSN